MARSLITTQVLPADHSGLVLTSEAANIDGNIIRGDRTLLIVWNGGGSPITVTVPTPGTISGLAIEDVVATVPAGAMRIIGTFAGALFRQTALGQQSDVHVNYSAVTSVSVAAFHPTYA